MRGLFKRAATYVASWLYSWGISTRPTGFPILSWNRASVRQTGPASDSPVPMIIIGVCRWWISVRNVLPFSTFSLITVSAKSVRLPFVRLDNQSSNSFCPLIRHAYPYFRAAEFRPVR